MKEMPSKSWTKFQEFATSQTGAGIQEREGDETFMDLVKRKCSFYYELLDVMVDRAATEPKVTNFRPESLDAFSDVDDEEIATETGTDNAEESPAGDSNNVASESNSVASSCKSSGGQNKKKSSRKRNSPLMDDETVDMLNQAQKTSKQKILEMQRHNKQVEEVEQKKLELQIKQEAREDLRLNLEQQRFQSQQWCGKSDELDYKMKLIKECTALKEQGLSKEQIITLFPEMAGVLEALEKANNN
jgi:hypothetical protein